MQRDDIYVCVWGFFFCFFLIQIEERHECAAAGQEVFYCVHLLELGGG